MDLLNKEDFVEALDQHTALDYLPRDRQGINGVYGNYLSRNKPEILHTKAGITYFVDGTTSVGSEVGKDLNLVKDLSPVELEEYAATKFLQVLNSSRRRGKEFNLSYSEVKRLVKIKTCYYTGLPMGTCKEEHPRQLTFDRVDPEKGYIKGNIVACTNAANQFKSKIEHEFSGVLTREKQLVMIQKMFA